MTRQGEISGDVQKAIVQLECMATNMMGDIQEGNQLAIKNVDAIDSAITSLQENERLKKELAFTRKFIHDQGMEFELLHQYSLATKH